ncbi:MAG: DUF167 domain-containing protein [Candidatus Omnitrophota bacterium]|nr:DUF167 domain-containing protein [Candidatus Omnitrophota bacterium]
MIINIRVIPKAKQNQVKDENSIFKIRTIAPAVDNKANAAVIKMLADFFGVRKAQVVIKKGEASRQKLIEIIGK